jgi:protein-L-isoaspartate(D-aspartate) O-methyltransferase
MPHRISHHTVLARGLWTAFLLLAAAFLPSCEPKPTIPAPRTTPRGDLAAAARVQGVKDPRVLHALASVPREDFVPPDQRPSAYDDRPLPIGHGQTISQPSLVALMTELLKLKPGDKVLEIGTGSGYQAALLAELTDKVYTIEIIPELAKTAQATLTRLGYRSVKVKTGDGYLGWKEYAPFDAIIVTCAPDHVPQPLSDQLKEGGRMVIPVGPDAGVQTLYLLEKQKGKLTSTAVVPVRFVPLVH